MPLFLKILLVVGLLIVARYLYLLYERKKRRRRYKKPSDITRKSTKEEISKDTLSWIWEFSKKIVVILSVLYVLGFVYSMYVMIKYQSFDYLGIFIEQSSDVLKVCVFGYLVKAGAENISKIIGSLWNKSSNSDDSNDSFSNDDDNQGLG